MLEHFDTRESPDGKRRRRCLAQDCQREYAYGVSTNHLKRHWMSVHKEFDVAPTVFILHDEFHIHCLIKLIIMEQLEYRFVESKYFKLYSKSLNSRKAVPSRDAIASAIIESVHKIREKIQELLNDQISVALTADLWTPQN